MNPFASRPDVRQRVYTAFWVVGVALGAVQVAFASADAGQPAALNVALGVYAFLGGAVGYTAQRNTDPQEG